MDKAKENRFKKILLLVIILCGGSMYIATENLLVFRIIHYLPIFFSMVLGLLIYVIYLRKEPSIIRITVSIIVIIHIGYIVFIYRYLTYKEPVDSFKFKGKTILVEEDLLGKKYFYEKSFIIKKPINDIKSNRYD